MWMQNSMMTSSKKIALAAGGTGGHVFPALALAEVLFKRGYKPVLFTDARGLKFVPDQRNYEVVVLKSGTIRKHPLHFAKDMAKLGIGFVQALRAMHQHRIALLVGFGGYPSLPSALGAALFGKPIIVHEQNAVLGKANILIGQFAKKIALSLPTSSLHPLPSKLAAKAVRIGNPVRADIKQLRHVPYGAATPTGLFHLLVVGGSLGASVFAHVVPKAIALLPAAMQAKLAVLAQVREADRAEAEALYQPLAVASYELRPFVADMAAQLQKAHLVICRAGASTVAEIAAIGRPALFVPYPHHGDAQQSRNAESLLDCGGAYLMEESGFTPEALAARLEPMLQAPDLLAKLAEKAHAQGLPEADETLADLVVSYL